jgi:hypothetical protein
VIEDGGLYEKFVRECTQVEGPVLVGAVHNNIAIGFNPHIGRVNLALAEFPNATYEPGVYFMAAIGSIYAADENGFCQWAVRRITDIGAVDIDWGGVRQIQAKFMKIDATMLYLEAEDQSVITAGTVDFVDNVNDGNVRNATSFTVCVCLLADYNIFDCRPRITDR